MKLPGLSDIILFGTGNFPELLTPSDLAVSGGDVARGSLQGSMVVYVDLVPSASLSRRRALVAAWLQEVYKGLKFLRFK